MWLHPAWRRDTSEVLSTLPPLHPPCPPLCWFKLLLKHSLFGRGLTETTYLRNA